MKRINYVTQEYLEQAQQALESLRPEPRHVYSNGMWSIDPDHGKKVEAYIILRNFLAAVGEFKQLNIEEGYIS